MHCLTSPLALYCITKSYAYGEFNISNSFFLLLLNNLNVRNDSNALRI